MGSFINLLDEQPKPGIDLSQDQQAAPIQPRFTAENASAEAARYAYSTEGLDLVQEGEDFSALLQDQRGRILRERLASIEIQNKTNRDRAALQREFERNMQADPTVEADIRRRALALQNPPYDAATDPDVTLEDRYTSGLTLDLVEPDLNSWEQEVQIKEGLPGPGAEDIQDVKTAENIGMLKMGMVAKAQEEFLGKAMLQSAIEKIQDKREERSWMSAGWDFTKEAIPFRTRAQAAGFGVNSIAGAIEDYRSRYERADVQGKKAIINEVMAMADDTAFGDSNLFNPEFILQYMQNPSAGNRLIANITDITDVAPLIGAGFRSLFRVAPKAVTADKALVNATVQQAAKQDGIAKMLGPTAETKTPTRLRQWFDYFKTDDLDSSFNTAIMNEPPELAKNMGDAMDMGYTIMSPKAIMNGKTAETLGSAMRRTKEALLSLDRNSPNNLFRKFQEQVGISRILPDETTIARVQKVVYDEIKRLNPRWEDRIVDVQNTPFKVSSAPVQEGPRGSLRMDILLGDEGGKLFDSVESANLAAREFYGLDTRAKGQAAPFQLHITDNGKVAIALTHEIDESTTGFRNALKFEGNKNPEAVTPSASLFGRFFRAKSETTSVASQKAALVSTEAANRLTEEAARNLKTAFNAMSRSNRKLLREWADHYHANPQKPIHTLEDFRESYNTLHGKLPDDASMAAFIRYDQQNTVNWILLNESKRLDMARQGYKMWGFEYTMPSGVKVKVHGQIPGKLMEPGKGIPWQSKEPFEVAALSRGIGQADEIPVISNYKFDKGKTSKGTAWDREFFEEKLRRGWKLIKLHDDGQEMISKLPQAMAKQLESGRVKFLLIEDATMQNLPARVVPFKPGFHRMMKYSHYLQAPVVKAAEGGKAFFQEAINIMNFRSKRHAAEYASVIEEARKRYLWAKDLPQGRTFYEAWRKKNLTGAFNWKEMKSLEKRGVDFQVPWAVKGETESWTPAEVNALYGNKFTEVSMGGVKSELSDFSEISDLSKSLKRDDRLKTMERTNAGGTKAEPHYKAVDAEILNPLEAIERQTAAMVHGRAMDDLKMRASAEFAANFGHLAADGIQRAEIDKNPYYFLMNRNALKEGGGPELNMAKSYQRGMYEILNSNTGLENWYQKNVAPILSESVLANSDNKFLRDSMHYMTEFIGGPDNIARMIKGWTFHAGLGFLNPKQLLLQATQFVTSSAIVGSPQKAGRAMMHHWLMRHYLRNPSTRTFWAEKAAKEADISANHFMAMADGFDRSGFHIVGNNTIYTEGTSPSKLWTENILVKSSSYPFEIGEKFNRSTAWSLATQEWLEKNPGFKGNKFTDEAIADILLRANTLSGDMLATSKATWQRGLAGIPTQFWSYNARLLDMYWGKKLSKAEKIRLFGVHAAVFGLPSAAGGTIGLVNVKRFYEQNWQDPASIGLDPQNDALDWLNEGALTMSIRMITGKDVDADAFGSDGLDLVNVVWDASQKDKDLGFFDMLLGASKRSAQSGFSVPYDALRGTLAVMSGEGIDVEDFTDSLKSISTISNLNKAWMIYQYKAIRTKRGEEITLPESDLLDSFLQTLGLPNHRIADFYTMKTVDYMEKKVKQDIMSQIRLYGKKANDPGTPWEEKQRLWKKSNALLIGAGLDTDPKNKAQAFKTFYGTSRTNFKNYIDRAARSGGSAAERKRRFEQQGQQ